MMGKHSDEDPLSTGTDRGSRGEVLNPVNSTSTIAREVIGTCNAYALLDVYYFRARVGLFLMKDEEGGRAMRDQWCYLLLNPLF